jgi:ABC-2 type transport system ATP-binding protein
LSKDEFCITIENLNFNYGVVQVLSDLSFNLEYGKVLGFLGSNGAGKTTTVKILASLLKPISGKVTIFGKDISKHSSEIRKRIGIVFQHPSFEENLTVKQALNLYGILWDIGNEKRKLKIKEILDDFSLNEIKDVNTSELSIGQKRRVQLAREFMHEMDLLFLDEPTVGLDPYARRLLLDHIKSRVDKGLTVFFTTHIMEEAEYLCDQIAILNKGKIVTIDTSAALKEKFGNIKIIEIKLKSLINENIKKIAESTSIDQPRISFPKDDLIRINAIDAQSIMSKMIHIFSKNDILIENISINSPTLEDVFLTLIEENRD